MRTTRDSVFGRCGLHGGLLAGVAAAALLSGLVSARAQGAAPAGSTTLDEISVEGQQPTFGTAGFVATRSTAGMKGNDSILETPATVSVITREELDVRGVQDINLATAYTPNVYAIDYPGGQGGPTFSLRGFNAVNFDSVYQDGLRYGFNSFDQNIEPYAYERIDVIKGPSSVLYGQGQPGGIINLVSKRPSFTRSNEVFLQGGSYNRIQAGFDLTGPVEGAPQFAYRITGLIRNSDSQVKYTPDDRTFIAPSITWKPDSDTSLTVLAKYAEYRGGGSEQALPIIGSILPSSRGQFQRDVFVGQPNFNTGLLENKEIGYVLDHSFAQNWLFHSAFRYYETDAKYNVVSVDPSFTPPGALSLATFPYARDQQSRGLVTDNHVEGQFNTFGVQHNVVAGVDYQDYHRSDNRQFVNGLPPTTTAAFTALGYRPYRYLVDLYNPVYGASLNFPDATNVASRQSIQQTGIYFQDQMKFNGLIFTGSVRNDWVDQELNTIQNFPRVAGLPIPPAFIPLALAATNTNTTSRQKFSALSYRLGLGYEFDSGIVPYVSYSTSFNPQAGSRFDGSALDPREAKQIEGGVKWQPVGTNQIYTASYFEITQTNISQQDPLHPGFLIQTGEVASKGFEFEAKANLFEGFNLVFGYAHLNTEVTKNPQDPTLVGKRLINAPNNTLSLFADYSFPQSSALGGLRAGAGVRYVGQRTDSTNKDDIPSYALVDATLSYDLAKLNPAWTGASLSVNASNLFDHRYYSASFYQGYIFEGYRRRVFGQLTYRW
ncbi:TonB-dependent siderophore receptor [Methylobacterium brachythecii]|uniref:Ferric siderophore receptor n=1 Tax=Methylobacterium brachythecii TaxID=1176177 RepID=A0A7W6AIP9_9HYPH|nr:TonB-dependent siderophore receptor [Methylobacterium brachythecii]MBB3901889.1 iron complex outermembrane receptor protein [Methylobacterium brachythecii]GLS43269.1 ferric siderophore receptor [Methylobacterium brachythecii]